MAGVEEQIAEIREKLTALANLDRDYRIFGAREHRYEMGLPLSEETLEGMERDFKARLPDDYRRFLMDLGCGGAGPYYGIFTPDGRDPEDSTDYDSLGNPFPYKAKVIRPRRDIPGALYLCHYGCALRFMLVVSGKCRGEVWHDWRADGQGIYPATNGKGERLSFAGWYLQWLESSLAELRT